MKSENFPAKAGSRKMRERPIPILNSGTGRYKTLSHTTAKLAESSGRRPVSCLLIAAFSTLVFFTPALAGDLTGKSENSAVKEGFSRVKNVQLQGLDKIPDGTRIMISTSGPAEFRSFWLDSPARLVVEFKTRNIISGLDDEVIVNQGAIKKITSAYFGSGEKKALKSLTFELSQKVPYKIWQEADTVIVDIQTTQENSVFPEEGKEIFAKNESKDVMAKKSQAMDTALLGVTAINSLPDTPKIIAELPKEPARKDSSTVFWFIGLVLVSGLGWLFLRWDRLILVKNMATQEIEQLKSQIAQKDKFLQQEEAVRKTIENTSLQKEKEFEQLKLVLQKEAKLLEQEETARKAKEEELLKKEKEAQQARNSYESLKEVLINKGLAKKLSSPTQEEELWISGKSSEKRQFPRLDLSKDYNRTIILRIESPDKTKSVKSFANNISLGGLCFEARKDFAEKEKINLRLFFFGDKVPIIKIKSEIAWKKTDSPVNHYGVSFVSWEDKDKTELSRYIGSKIAEIPVSVRR